MFRSVWLPLVAVSCVASALTGCGASTSSDTSIEGTTGSVSGKAPSEKSATPIVEFDKLPFSVDETTVEVITEGDGDAVAPNATVMVDYYGVNGRTGKVFDTTYNRGTEGESSGSATAAFPLDRVVPGFAKGIAGQKIGSDVLVAIPPKDGYGTGGQPAAGIGSDDTMVFFIHIVDVEPTGVEPEVPAEPEAGTEGTTGDGTEAEGTADEDMGTEDDTDATADATE